MCHYIFYYTAANWIVFSCLYSNQEIRLTDVPLILMATLSRHSILAVVRHLLPPFLLSLHSICVSLIHTLSLPRLMCFLHSKGGNFHMESQPGSGDLDLTPCQRTACTGKCKRIRTCAVVVVVGGGGVAKACGCSEALDFWRLKEKQELSAPVIPACVDVTQPSPLSLPRPHHHLHL